MQGKGGLHGHENGIPEVARSGFNRAIFGVLGFNKGCNAQQRFG
jgi:hypothetical protein